MKGPITTTRRTRYRRHFGPDFWVLDLGEWRFIGLNAQLLDSGLAAEKTQMKFLENALESVNGLSIAILTHKPLFIRRDNETGRSLSSIWPLSRKELCPKVGDGDIRRRV